MSQLVQTGIVICSIALAVLLFYAAYFLCKKYATSDDSDEIQDYIEQHPSNIFKEKFLFIQTLHKKILPILKIKDNLESKRHVMLINILAVSNRSLII